jgi:protein CpxP
MKSVHTLIASAVLATMGLTAWAQTTTPTAPGAAPVAREARGHGDPAKMQARIAKMQERMAKRMAELKQKLQLTAAQEGAWTSFTTAMKPAARPQRMDRDAFAKLSTPDRIDHMRSVRTTRIAEMDRRADATKAFYATLTPDQKKVFDGETLRRGHKGHHGHRGHRG